MTKTPEQVARDVINGLTEEHDLDWWRNRASTLAVKYLSEATEYDPVLVAEMNRRYPPGDSRCYDGDHPSDIPTTKP